MSDGAIHEMSRVVGGLQASVGSLQASIENLNKTWGERERDATAGRRILHSKFDELRDDVTRLSAELENVSKDITIIRPSIDASEPLARQTSPLAGSPAVR